MITYQIEEKIGIEEFTQVLVNSTLGERRPVKRTGKNNRDAAACQSIATALIMV